MAEKLPEVTDQEWSEVEEWNRDIVEEFLQQNHLSPQTLNQYRSALRQFFRWVKDNCKNKPLYQLKPRDALKYQNYLIDRQLSSSAIKFKRSAVSSLCGYVEIFWSDDDDCKNFRNIYNKNIPNPAKSLQHEKQPLTPEEYNKLVKTLEKRKEWQMLAYVRFTYATGCRRAEARQLLKEVAGYDKFKDKNYYVTHQIRCKGKGREGKVRRLNFDEEAMKAIKKWLEVRGQDDCPYVFAKKTKGGVASQISISTFNTWCQNTFSEIVGRRVHPHMFRSTRATHIVALDGKDIKSAQALLGHESSVTTELYVIRDSDDSLDDAFD